MHSKLLLLTFFIVSFIAVTAQKTNKAIPVIFDTDMGPDYDDVGAIALLHAFADSGEVKILATIASTKYDGVASVINVLNTYFNRPDIPVAVPKGNALELRDWQHWSDSLIAEFPHAIDSNNEVPNAVELYRKTLAAQPDHSVTIVTVGFLTNLANLLKSNPDEYSSLSGKDLVTKKVRQLVSMAGKFPEGQEFNIDEDATSSKYTYENWPTPVLFTGFEIGEKIKTGLPLIHDEAIQNSPVKKVFSICIPKAAEDSAGRMSWDETAVLVAVKGYEPFYTVKKGRIIIDEKGYNRWDVNGGEQMYLVEKASPQIVQDYINNMMMHQPVKK